MKVLVTGGLGYIGTHLSIALSKLGHEVHIVDKRPIAELETDHYNLIRFKVKSIEQHDTSASEFMQAFLGKNFDMIYHLAESATLSDYDSDMVQINCNKKSITNLSILIDAMCGRKKICRLTYVAGDIPTTTKAAYAKGFEQLRRMLSSYFPYVTVILVNNVYGVDEKMKYRFFNSKSLCSELSKLRNDPSYPFTLRINNGEEIHCRKFTYIHSLINVLTKRIDVFRSETITCVSDTIPIKVFVSQFLKACDIKPTNAKVTDLSPVDYKFNTTEFTKDALWLNLVKSIK